MQVKWPYIKWHDACHCLEIGNENVQLSPMEYKIAQIIWKGAATFDHISRALYGEGVTRTRMANIDQYVSRMRGKMEGTGLRPYCVHRYGYILLPDINYCRDI